MVTADKKRGIRQYFWAEDNKTLLYLQDNDGDENFHVYGVDLRVGQRPRLHAVPGRPRRRRRRRSRTSPTRSWSTLNVRNRQAHRRLPPEPHDRRARRSTPRTPATCSGWDTDAKFQVRAAQVGTPDGGTEIRVRDDAKSPWKTLVKVGPGRDPRVRRLLRRRQVRLPEDLRRQRHGAARRARPRDRTPRRSSPPRRRSTPATSLDPPADARRAGGLLRRRPVHVEGPRSRRSRPTSTRSRKLHDGDFPSSTATAPTKTWLVAFTSDRGPVSWYTWDRAAKKGTLPLLRAAQARRAAARRDEAGRHQGARRAEAATPT